MARTKVPWISPPTVYSPSIYYLKKHFGRFDPYRLHDEPADQVVATADVPGLYQNSANAEAQRLTVSGNLVGEPRVIEYTGKPVASYLAVLVDSNTPNLALMCRVPADQRTMRLTDGDRVTVTGVLLAEGSSRNANGGPSVFTMYMICSNIAKSTNITMTKRGIAINE
ncbi:MAG: hypothetical protein ACRDKE_08525 [Solirubrobacterales bacterium]